MKLPLFKKGKTGGIKFERKNSPSDEFFLYGFIFLIALIFILLFLRLFQLTVVKGKYFYQLSEENRIRELIIEGERGKILDRKGFTIAKNLPADLTKNEPRLKSPRLYYQGETIASLIGYRQIADKDDLKNDFCPTKLKLGDRVGKKGVEKLYECQLRGRAGKKLIEVDAKGKYLKTLTILPATVGKTIQLAIDLELQQKAYQLMNKKKGAIIAIKPNTGEILSLVSSPSFNPQDFEEENQSAIKKYLTDKDKPLFSRATAGVYPPGSIFKLVVGAAALEEKVISEKTVFEDTGTINAGPLTFGNWYFLQYGKTEGMVDIVKAIQRSNDIFFYHTGAKLKPEKIKKWAELFGFEKQTAIGLEEEEGFIPSPFWKEDQLKEPWYLGDTYNLSIGQGYITVTPLQIADLTATFANGGYLCPPKLLKIGNRKWQIEKECRKLPLSSKTLKLIKEGMRRACSSGGTDWPLFNFKIKNSNLKIEEIQIACKTGTAESYSKNTPPHAWITVFAPFEKPEIALTVLVEEGGQGSDVAGPIAREILRAYFERKE